MLLEYDPGLISQMAGFEQQSALTYLFGVYENFVKSYDYQSAEGLRDRISYVFQAMGGAWGKMHFRDKTVDLPVAFLMRTMPNAFEYALELGLSPTERFYSLYDRRAILLFIYIECMLSARSEAEFNTESQFVRRLLEMGVNLQNDPDPQNTIGLHKPLLFILIDNWQLAIKRNHFKRSSNFAKLFNLMLEQSLQIDDLVAPLGVNLLGYAIHIQNEALTEFFLKAGANPNLPNQQGISPFLQACAMGNLALLELLTEYGGNPNLVFSSPTRPTALHMAINGVSFLGDAERAIQTIRYLILNGADWRARSAHRSLLEEAQALVNKNSINRSASEKVLAYLQSQEFLDLQESASHMQKIAPDQCDNLLNPLQALKQK